MASQVQIGLLHHALGVNAQQHCPYRNRFVAGPGHHDLADLETLERDGLMERARTPSFLAASDIVFMVTDAGRDVAMAALPTLRKRTRVDDWYARDGSESFGEFLCGDRLPQFERREAPPGEPRGRWGSQYRMFRCRHRYDEPEICGDWKPTKKQARASYKAALALHKARATA
ncbi:hypothetical protein [Burkholderia cepacia]|uniref:hypothetical protein n=1 Tax=Burkholderia cepacia TaxID=292 RepID=UPI002AB6506C|nr:hypothetical protein [Burkholderia cepacia]